MEGDIEEMIVMKILFDIFIARSAKNVDPHKLALVIYSCTGRV